MDAIRPEVLDVIIKDALCGECPLATVDIDNGSVIWDWCEFWWGQVDDPADDSCKRDRDPSVCSIRDCWIHYAEVRLAEEAKGQ